ncbi:unnamed protein product [Zymoseptoria tritici ST99CH_3D7]|uniref:Uncharacterized protein n=1 Tax=Zymoseptoria tritici (strain ST99CH_3D7) TaxID=1276538 RepID=A0A1X7SAB5_ZYMT9|nr:unnamed protein product [Zymoseptoria tritici ST99CH_3D7]
MNTLLAGTCDDLTPITILFTTRSPMNTVPDPSVCAGGQASSSQAFSFAYDQNPSLLALPNLPLTRRLKATKLLSDDIFVHYQTHRQRPCRP